MTNIITLDQLVKLGACEWQIDEFQRCFGSQVEVTVEEAVNHAYDFDWDWAGEYLLPADKQLLHNACIDTLYGNYKEKLDEILRQRRDAVAETVKIDDLNDRRRALDKILSKYREKQTAAYKVYRRERARRWAELFLGID